MPSSHPIELRRIINTTLADAPSESRSRLGPIIKSLFTTCCGGAMLITAAAVLNPAALQAESTLAPAHIATPQQAHADLLATVASIIAGAHQPLVIKPGNADRGTEIILWLEDRADAGVINADELALLRHNPLFETLTLYQKSTSQQVNKSKGQGQPLLTFDVSPFDGLSAPLTREDIATPGFIDRWRAMSVVQARILATGLSDMQLEPLATGGQGDKASRRQGVGHTPDTSTPPSMPQHLNDSSPSFSAPLSNLRLRLKWTSDSADGSDEASTVLQGRKSTSQQVEAPGSTSFDF